MAGLVLTAAYIYVVARNYLAERLGQVPAVGTLQRATRLAPWNAALHWRLGRYRFTAQQDAPGAIRDYRAAVALNPYVAQYWFDLATAYMVSGDSEDQRQALDHAVKADPTNPDVSWEAANFYVVQGNLTKAFGLFRTIIANDPASTDAALRTCWAAAEKKPEVVLDKALPPSADAYFAFLQLLIHDDERAAADMVWARILPLSPLAAKLAFPYLDYLWTQKRISDVERAWAQLVAASPELKPYVIANELVVNGGFEYPVLNGGLDWHYTVLPAIALSIDSTAFHGGTRSLSIEFDGPAGGQTGVSQVVPVQPNTRYRLRLFARAEEITSASGPRIVVEDVFSHKVLLMSDDFLGTQEWQQVQGTFTTAPDSAAVVVTVMRIPGDSLIKGKFWLDDVSLVPQPSGGGPLDGSR